MHVTDKPLPLRHNFSWAFAGNIVYAASSWAMIVALAKLGSTQIVGEYAFGLAVAQPILAFAQLNLRALQATDARHEYNFGDYFRLRMIALALALLIIGGLAFLGGHRWELALVIFVSGVGAALDSVSDLFYGLQQQHERMDRIAISMAIKGPLSLLGLAAGIYFTGSVVWAVAGSALASAVVVAGYDIPSGAALLRLNGETSGKESGVSSSVRRSRWNGRTLASLAWLALPMGVTMLLVSLTGNVSRYYVEGFLGERSLGIFTALSSLLRIGGNFTGALGQSASPRLSQFYAAGQRVQFTALLTKLAAMGGGLGFTGVAIAYLGGKPILRLFFKPEYAEHLDVLLWLMAAGGLGFIVSFLGYGITAARHFKIQIVWYMLALAATVVTSWKLIPLYGLKGAAMAIFISTALVLMSGVAILYHVLRTPIAGSTADSQHGTRVPV